MHDPVACSPNQCTIRCDDENKKAALVFCTRLVTASWDLTQNTETEAASLSSTPSHRQRHYFLSGKIPQVIFALRHDPEKQHQDRCAHQPITSSANRTAQSGWLLAIDKVSDENCCAAAHENHD
jgi:hypothetical protein